MPTNIKLYLDLAAGLIVAVFIGWFVHHERETGRQEIKDADAKVVAAQVQHNADVEALGKLHAAPALEAYQSALSSPVDRPISVRMCIPAIASGAGTTDNGGGPGPGANEGRGLPGGVGSESAGIDIGPITDQLLAQATAKVRALQAYIRSCQEEGVCRADSGQADK